MIFPLYDLIYQCHKFLNRTHSISIRFQLVAKQSEDVLFQVWEEHSALYTQINKDSYILFEIKRPCKRIQHIKNVLLVTTTNLFSIMCDKCLNRWHRLLPCHYRHRTFKHKSLKWSMYDKVVTILYVFEDIISATKEFDWVVKFSINTVKQCKNISNYLTNQFYFTGSTFKHYTIWISIIANRTLRASKSKALEIKRVSKYKSMLFEKLLLKGYCACSRVIYRHSFEAVKVGKRRKKMYRR